MRPILPAFCAAAALLLSGCGDRSTASASTSSEAAPAAASSTTSSSGSTETGHAKLDFAPAPAAAKIPEVKYDAEVAVITTTEGEITVAFRSDKAPGTVENFKKLAKAGFYNGTAFHRIIKGFMVQGGDPLTKDLSQMGRWGQGGPGYTIKAEFNDLHHGRGVISMARSSHPDSAGSQFFICDTGAGFLDGKYTGFGQVIKGDDVLGKILDTPVTGSSTGENSLPAKRIEIKTVTIVPAGVAK